jgi:hypothetical protein
MQPIVWIMGLLLAAVSVPPAGAQAEAPPGWRLLWQDGFDGPGIDERNWIVMGPGGPGDSGHYDPAKVRVRDGHLVLTAGDRAGRTTGGQVRSQIFYGPHRGERRTFRPPVRIEIRADYELAYGSAGSFWLLGAGWTPSLRHPDIALIKEFDIIELHGAVTARGTGPDRYHHTAHVHRWDRRDGRSERSRKQLHGFTTPDGPAGNLIDGPRWVTFAIEWLTGPNDHDRRVRYLVDGHVVHEKSVMDWPAEEGWRDDIRQIWDEPMGLILTCDALGQPNLWGGVADLDGRNFPIDCRFDYIRVFVPVP